jgi:hypothetical protein
MNSLFQFSKQQLNFTFTNPPARVTFGVVGPQMPGSLALPSFQIWGLHGPSLCTEVIWKQWGGRLTPLINPFDY